MNNPLTNPIRRVIKAKLVVMTVGIVVGVVCMLTFVTARNSASAELFFKY